MRFPETTRCGTDAHDSAVDRLDSARAKRLRLAAAAAAALGSRAEPRAIRELELAQDDEAARGAWLVWVERGV
jgi:hypothetical protein